MHIERKEIQDNCALLLVGDVSFKDFDTVERTLRMVLPYKNITVHLVYNPGAVGEGVQYLLSCRHPNLRLKEYATYDHAVEEAVALRNENCRVCCMVYWNGKDQDTLNGLRCAARHNVETAVVPHSQQFDEQEAGLPTVSP